MAAAVVAAEVLFVAVSAVADWVELAVLVVVFLAGLQH